MEKFSLEKLNKPESSVEENELFLEFEKRGLERDILKEFLPLIEKIRFVNIDTNKKCNNIHFDIVASLLTKQENKEILLQNILKEINHNLKETKELLVFSTKEIAAESIDFEIGTNRRVDRISCLFEDGTSYDFTVSADFDDYRDDNNSNSFVEKEVFNSPLGQDNPVMQKYFAYLKKEMSGRSRRFIMKEYLPGKNIVQYFNEIENDEDFWNGLNDVSCELAYSMGYLYQRMGGKLLEDLKLENIIYNYENPDSDLPACRICDHSGYYGTDVEKKSVSQIMANISSLLAIYSVKDSQGREKGALKETFAQEDVVINYLDSFCSQIESESIKNTFLEKIKEIRQTPVEKRMFATSDDLLDFSINYLKRESE